MRYDFPPLTKLHFSWLLCISFHTTCRFALLLFHYIYRCGQFRVSVARSLLRPMTSFVVSDMPNNYKGRRVLDNIISLRGNRFDVGYLFRAVSAPRVYVNNWTADERRNTFQPTNQTFIAVSTSQWLLKCSVGGMVGLGFWKLNGYSK